MENKKIFFIVIFLVFSSLISVIFYCALSDFFIFLKIENFFIFGDIFNAVSIVSASIGYLIGYYICLINKKSKKFILECLIELNKSYWPTINEVITKTVIVVVVSFVSAIILGFFDSLFPWLINNKFFIY